MSIYRRVYWFLCCPHAEKSLPQLPAQHKSWAGML